MTIIIQRKLQVNILFARLPDLLAKINKRIVEIKAAARKLPPPLDGDPVTVVTQLIVAFQRIVDHEITGTTSGHGLVQRMKAHTREFRHQLRGTAPRFIPFRPDIEKARRQSVPSIRFLPEEEQDLGDEGSHPVLYLSDLETRAEESVYPSECCSIVDPSRFTVPYRVNYRRMCHLP